MLTPQDLKLIGDIQDRVVQEVGSDRFSPVPLEQVKERIEEKGCLGAFYQGTLVAVVVDFLDRKALPKYTDKTGIPLTLEEGYRQYFYIVNPDFRGFSITQHLFDRTIQYEKERGTTHALATVATDNIASIKVLLRGGMQIRYVGPVYGEKIRFITYKNLQNPREVVTPEDIQWVNAADLDTQHKLISDGWVGNQIELPDDQIVIGYQR